MTDEFNFTFNFYGNIEGKLRKTHGTAGMPADPWSKQL